HQGTENRTSSLGILFRISCNFSSFSFGFKLSIILNASPIILKSSM
ncbi:MAG: hypothetical protein ACI8VT_002192, partial [Saprospiraceae bacterium]